MLLTVESRSNNVCLHMTALRIQGQYRSHPDKESPQHSHYPCCWEWSHCNGCSRRQRRCLLHPQWQGSHHSYIVRSSFSVTLLSLLTLVSIAANTFSLDCEKTPCFARLILERLIHLLDMLAFCSPFSTDEALLIAKIVREWQRSASPRRSPAVPGGIIPTLQSRASTSSRAEGKQWWSACTLRRIVTWRNNKNSTPNPGPFDTQFLRLEPDHPYLHRPT